MKISISDKIVKHGVTFDDVLLIPRYSNFKRQDINLTTHLTRKITLKRPLISAPMDTVTESGLAIALGKAGGVGIIHRNLTPEQQAKEIDKTKTAGVIAAAAIGGGTGALKRAEELVKAGAEVIVVDSAHGFADYILETVSALKNRFSALQVIGGNIATYEGAIALIKAGADALRVGMGPGAICTTRVISGMGVPQITAILETARAAHEHDVPVIADGGIKYSGDIVKALAAGASCVMMGSMFASATEAPGETIELPQSQVPSRFKSIFKKGMTTYTFKSYRGMGSIGAMQKGTEIKSEDEFHGKSYKDRVLVAEGVEGLVPINGTVEQIVDQLTGGIRSGMYYVGAKSIAELWERATFMQITQASLTESHPHDIIVTNSGQNYS